MPYWHHFVNRSAVFSVSGAEACDGPMGSSSACAPYCGTEGNILHVTGFSYQYSHVHPCEKIENINSCAYRTCFPNQTPCLYTQQCSDLCDFLPVWRLKACMELHFL